MTDGNYFFVLLVLAFVTKCYATIPQCKNIPNPEDPEQCLPSDGIIRRWGYEVERHTVTTEDLYKLTLFRIPPKHLSTTNGTDIRRVVFLQHGLLSSSDTWLMNLPNQTLAFLLADAGFEVWLGNSRGNRYSRAHVNLNPDKDKGFWMFSWDQMADYDLPAAINYVLNVTQKDNLEYVAHSQGSLIGFTKFSTDPKLAKKIRTMFALAPIGRVAHITSAIRDFAYPWLMNTFKSLLYHFNMYEFGTNDNIDERLSQWFCREHLRWKDYLCKSILFWVEGFNEPYTNMTRAPVYLTHTPAGTSLRDIIHLGQMVSSGLIQHFDFGEEKNKKVYGQVTLPVYDVTPFKVSTVLFSGGFDSFADPTDVAWLESQIRNANIESFGYVTRPYLLVTPPVYDVTPFNVPTVLFSGGIDSFADPTDVAWLESQIRNATIESFVYPDFNHLDFTFGLGAASNIYDVIIKYIRR